MKGSIYTVGHQYEERVKEGSEYLFELCRAYTEGRISADDLRDGVLDAALQFREDYEDMRTNHELKEPQAMWFGSWE